jgi:hypothetical protein
MRYFHRILTIRNLLSLTYSLGLIPHPHSLTLIQVTGPNGHICFYFHDKKEMRDAIEWIQARKEGHVANMVDAVGMDVKEAKTEADQEGE